MCIVSSYLVLRLRVVVVAFEQVVAKLEIGAQIEAVPDLLVHGVVLDVEAGEHDEWQRSER